MPGDYYTEKLSAYRLRRVYEIAPRRVQQYLQAEANHVLGKINPADTVLELGCGYGRILPLLAQKAHRVVGIDTSLDSLVMGHAQLGGYSNCFLSQMDAIQLAFRQGCFDVAVCIQNGISAFHVDQRRLIEESLRVVRPGGLALFSSYSEKFWENRLKWFRLQSEAGLLGEIDLEKSRDGRIVCKDGFTATTVGPDDFLSLTRDLHAQAHLVEVDESSLFCEITPRSS